MPVLHISLVFHPKFEDVLLDPSEFLPRDAAMLARSWES